MAGESAHLDQLRLDILQDFSRQYTLEKRAKCIIVVILIAE
jgi:hypothetical protein